MSPTPVLERRNESDVGSDARAHGTHRHHVRSPVDVLRLIIGASLVALGIGIANLLDSAFLGLSADGTTAMDSFPDWVVDVLAAALTATILVAVAVLALWTISTGRFRRLLLFTTATALAVVASVAVGQVIFSIIDESVVMGATKLRSHDDDTCRVPLGVGPGCQIRRAIIDLDARVGASSKLLNVNDVDHADGPNYIIRDGIIVIPRDAELPPGTVI